MADNWCFCDEFCKLPQKISVKFWESLYKLSKQGTLNTVSKLIATGFSSMMIGIVVFSMLVIGAVEWSRAAVPVSGGSSGSGGMVTSGGSATTTNGTMSASQNTGAAKKTVQTSAAGQGQSVVQVNNTSQSSNAKTQTKQTTKTKQVQKSKAKVTVRNTINAAQRGSRVRSVVSSSRRGAIVGTRAARTVGQSLRYSLRMRQPVARFSSGGRAPAINAFAHSRFERGTKKAKEGKGNEGGAATKTQSGGASQAQSR